MIRKTVRSILKKFGYQISPIAGLHNSSPTFFNNFKINKVFDIGANIGQYAINLRKQGYKGKIISFEPLPNAYVQLKKNSRNDSLWRVHPRIALGSKNGFKKIFESHNSYSSSILKVLDKHLEGDKGAKIIDEHKIKIKKLDSIFINYVKKNDKILVKIDSQGYEDKILKGFNKNINKCFAIQIELSLVRLYKNQKTYEYFFSFFKKKNFFLWSIIPSFINRKDGQHLQIDAIFVKNLKKVKKI